MSSIILYYQCQSGHEFICIDSQSSFIVQENDSLNSHTVIKTNQDLRMLLISAFRFANNVQRNCSRLLWDLPLYLFHAYILHDKRNWVLKFSNSYPFATWLSNHLRVKNYMIRTYNIYSFKCVRSTTLGCKDIWFVAKNQFLC